MTTPTVTKKQFLEYYAIQKSGKYNMMATWEYCSPALPEDVVKAIILVDNNYRQLHDKYITKPIIRKAKKIQKKSVKKQHDLIFITAKEYMEKMLREEEERVDGLNKN